MTNEAKRLCIERLKWQSRRSQLELDLLFEPFVSAGGIEKLSNRELNKYKELLTFDDTYLLMIFYKKIRCFDDEIQKIIDNMLAYIKKGVLNYGY